jgi:hypothetical protein
MFWSTVIKTSKPAALVIARKQEPKALVYALIC